MSEIMRFGKGVASGEGAVLLSSLINTEVLNRFGIWAMAGVSAPIVEELTKTGFAEGINGDVLMSHVTFGSHEGFLYARDSGTITQFDHRRPLLHASFGVMYLVGRRFGGNPAAGLLTSMLAHFIWNQIALLRTDWDSIVSDNEKSDSELTWLGGARKREVTIADIKRAILI